MKFLVDAHLPSDLCRVLNAAGPQRRQPYRRRVEDPLEWRHQVPRLLAACDFAFAGIGP